MTSALDADALVAVWRSGDGADNPAGPLFSDPFTESDLTTPSAAHSDIGCSFCTASRAQMCC